jgi:hypothetical protein
MPLILDDYSPWLDPKSQTYRLVTPSAQEMKTYWASEPVENSSWLKRILWARVKSVFGGYPLPDGLPEGATVNIRAFDGGWYDVELDGQVFRVFSACVAFQGETGALL